MRRFIFILLLLAMGICAFYMLEQINMTSYALAVSRLSSSYFIEVYRNGDSRSLNEAKYIVDHAKPNFSKPQRDDSGCLS